jgi:hypothetical protein
MKFPEIKLTPPQGTKVIDPNVLEAMGKQNVAIRQNADNLESMHIQYTSDMAAAIKVFEDNTKAVEANTQEVRNLSESFKAEIKEIRKANLEELGKIREEIAPLTIWRKDFLTFRNISKIIGLSIGSAFFGIAGIWTALQKLGIIK